jgi:hypothetical protein
LFFLDIYCCITIIGVQSAILNQSRKARTGSVRVALHAGKKHAASEATSITANAAPNASGSRGLT